MVRCDTRPDRSLILPIHLTMAVMRLLGRDLPGPIPATRAHARQPPDSEGALYTRVQLHSN